MTEDQLLTYVTERCNDLGFRMFHARDSRRDDGKGFPDLVIAGYSGALFRELKSDSGQLETEQALWKWRLMACGADWGLWRPADWRSGQIEKELKSIQ